MAYRLQRLAAVSRLTGSRLKTFGLYSNLREAEDLHLVSPTKMGASHLVTSVGKMARSLAGTQFESQLSHKLQSQTTRLAKHRKLFQNAITQKVNCKVKLSW